MFGFLDNLFKSPEGKALLAGAAIAGTGGATAPAVLGAEAGATGLLSAEAAGGAGLLGEGVASGVPAWDMAAGSGSQLKALGSAASDFAKPAMYGLQAASMAKGLFSSPQSQTPASPITPAQGGNLQAMYSQIQQSQANQQQIDEQKRAQRRAMIYQGNNNG